MKFIVPVVVTVSGHIIIEADSLEDAQSDAQVMNETTVDLDKLQDTGTESEVMIGEIRAMK